MSWIPRSTPHTSTIKYVSVILVILVAVNNGLGIMAGDIGNTFCMSPCTENIWSRCGADFGPRCGAVVVPKRNLYGLETTSNSFHKYFLEFLRNLGHIPSIADQDLWIRKYDDYEEYYYIATYLDDIIIYDKNPY